MLIVDIDPEVSWVRCGDFETNELIVAGFIEINLQDLLSAYGQMLAPDRFWIYRQISEDGPFEAEMKYRYLDITSQVNKILFAIFSFTLYFISID